MTETKMYLVDWLDDLCVRFIINLPQEELESVERICFQVEEAQWYYEDFIRPLDPELPSLNLRNFCLRIFQHCPLLSEFSPYHHATAFEEFLAYKTRVPVRGAIMLNRDMDQVILVKGWKKGANWSFPRGKINKDESDLACAVREVYEETGYDVDAAGLVGPPAEMKHIDVAIQHQHIRLYVFRGVPMDTYFEARTRKEISKIDWWRLSDLPTLKKKKQQQEGRGEDLALNANKFYMVAPFLVPLKKWISQQKKLGTSNSVGQIQHPKEDEVEEPPPEINSVKVDGAVSTSEDMGRLLAGLQNTPQESGANPFQGVNTGSLADAASIQLKNLLRVPTQDSTGAKVPPSAQESKASTLLALLRGDKQTGKPLEPSTPLDVVTEASVAPESPKPQHTMKPRLATLPRPPVFQIDQHHEIQTHPFYSSVPDTKVEIAGATQNQQASINAWNTFETTSANQEAERKRVLSEKRAAELAREKETGVRYEPKLPLMNETWRQIKVHDTSDMGQATQRQVVNVIKRPVDNDPQPQDTTTHQLAQQRATSNVSIEPTVAPYQVTSNVEPSDKSQYQDVYRPTIPAANKLPMPKLTSHSSTLLDLFRNGQKVKKAPASERVKGSPTRATIPHTTSDLKTTSNATEQLRLVSGNTGPSGLASTPPSIPSSIVEKTGDAKLSQSSHQLSLLELFRKPLLSAKASSLPSKTTLDVPVDIVELSAVPSPRHYKHVPDADFSKSQKMANMPATEPNHLRKKNTAKHQDPSLSATVNGPLNVPQFEKIARKGETSTKQKPSSVQAVKKSPVTILARPLTAKANEQLGLPESTLPHEQHAKAPTQAVAPPVGLKPHIDQAQEPKPFQPQILRRPPQISEKPHIRQPPTVQSSVRLSNGERDSPSPLSASDQPRAMKPEHKATLLSLFTESESPSQSHQAVSRPDYSAFVSPVATKPPVTFPLLSERLNSNVSATTSSPGKGMLPPSRKGSGALPPTVGMSRVHSREQQIPERKTTSDVDRNFLLGYLEDVAKKEGR